MPRFKITVCLEANRAVERRHPNYKRRRKLGFGNELYEEVVAAGKLTGIGTIETGESPALSHHSIRYRRTTLLFLNLGGNRPKRDTDLPSGTR